MASCLSTISALAQDAELRGRVTNASGEPLIGVTVKIEGTHKGSLTDINGYYRIPLTTSAGKIRLIYSYIGYETQSKDLNFSPKAGRLADKHQHLNIIMTEQNEALQTIEVVGRRESSYKNSQSFSGTKTALQIVNIPQSIGYVTKELALDQGALTVNEVVKNISGVSQYSGYNDFSIRGFRVMGNRNSGNLINGMRMQSSFWSKSSLANIERVEVIKGPASALFGNASPGGVINRVTKKPLPYKQNSISTSFGSFSTLTTQADFTGPLNEKQNLLYRLNLGYETSDGFRDLQNYEQYIISPSFSFLPSERTRVNLDLVYQQYDGKIDRGQTIFRAENMDIIPITAAIAASDDYLKEKQLHLNLSITQKISDNLSLNGIYSSSLYGERLYEHTASGYLLKADLTRDETKAALVARKRIRDFRNNAVNFFINWDNTWGKVHNKLLVGYDYFETSLLPSSSELTAQPYLDNRGRPTASITDKNQPTDTSGAKIIKLNQPAFDLTEYAASYKLRQAEDVTSKTIWTDRTTTLNPYQQTSHGIYIQNHLEYSFLKVLLGLRQEYFIDYTNKGLKIENKVQQSALLPRIGLVATLNDNINLYATWLKGYDPQAASVQNNPNSGGPFKPMTSELWETGVKSEWLGRRISATLALFHLKQEGSLYRAIDPKDPGNTDYRIQIGQEISKGLELDVLGYILPNWSVSTSYTYNQAEITQSTNDKEIGKQLPNTPKHAFNLWTKYIFTAGLLKDFGMGVGYNFVDARNGSIGSQRGDDLSLPSYQLVNLALYYKVGKMQLQLNVNNLFNQKHWTGGYDTVRIFPGKPRNVQATLSYKF